MPWTLDSSDFADFEKDLGVAIAYFAHAETMFALLSGAQIATEARELAQRGSRMQRSAARDIQHIRPGEVIYGGRPYSIGAEYGSWRYSQFESWHGAHPSPTEGYFFWPAVRHFQEREMNNLWDTEVWDQTFAQAFNTH